MQPRLPTFGRPVACERAGRWDGACIMQAAACMASHAAWCAHAGAPCCAAQRPAAAPFHSATCMRLPPRRRPLRSWKGLRCAQRMAAHLLRCCGGEREHHGACACTASSGGSACMHHTGVRRARAPCGARAGGSAPPSPGHRPSSTQRAASALEPCAMPIHPYMGALLGSRQTPPHCTVS